MSRMKDATPRPPTSRHRGRQARFSVEASAVVHAGDGDFSCTVEDLSRSGVRLAGNLPTSLDRILDLTLRGGRSDPELRIRARPARWTEGPGGRGAAFEFLDVAADQHRGIDRLVESRAARAPDPGAGLDALRPGASLREIRAALESIAVPQRIALAARAGRKERDALRHDSLPAVLDALARNSQLTLAEARALAASPHLSPGTLEALAADSRWDRDEELRVAIVSNSRTPPPLADRLVGELGADRARRLLRRPGLAPLARERLSRRVARSH